MWSQSNSTTFKTFHLVYFCSFGGKGLKQIICSLIQASQSVRVMQRENSIWSKYILYCAAVHNSCVLDNFSLRNVCNEWFKGERIPVIYVGSQVAT